MTLWQAQVNLGRAVVYHQTREREHGVITSVNEKYVFVRYGSNHHSQATSPEDLSFADEVEP